MVHLAILLGFFDYNTESVFWNSSVVVVGIRDRLIGGACNLPVDFLPRHQKLNRTLPLGANISISFNPCLDHSLHFVRPFLDLFRCSAETALRISDKILSPSESVKSQLLSKEIKRRRNHRRSNQALLQSGEAGIR